MIGSGESSWTSLERHPAGEELVVVISGQMTLVQELDGVEHRLDLTEGSSNQPTQRLAHRRHRRELPHTLHHTGPRNRASTAVTHAQV